MDDWVASQVQATEGDGELSNNSNNTTLLPCVTRRLSGARGDHAETFTIEQNGYHAVLVLSTRGDAICFDRSSILFPTRLTDRSNPRGYLQCQITDHEVRAVSQRATQIRYDGVRIRLSRGCINEKDDRFAFTYSIFVSPDSPVVHALLEYGTSPFGTNSGRTAPPPPSSRVVCQAGGYTISYMTHWRDTKICHSAWTCIPTSQIPSPLIDLQLRTERALQWVNHLTLECPDQSLSTWFQFANIRTSEAFFDAPTLGRVHSPGGQMFYCGVWCNDQAEYAAPLHPFLHGPGTQGRIAMAHTLTVLADHFDMVSRQIPYSIEIDGGYIGRLDRGDAAMFALGASQFLLACYDYHQQNDTTTTTTTTTTTAASTSLSASFLGKGQKDLVQPLLPCILFAADLLVERMAEHPDGVIPSQSDELEGRYPTGDVNLSTNCLAICALESVSELLFLLSSSTSTMSSVSGGSLRNRRQAVHYHQSAVQLRANVDKHFETLAPWKYDYFSGCGVARGWICLSEMARLQNGRSALRYALTTLWTRTGVKVTADNNDIWDRTTMYCITNALQAGLQDLALDRLKQVCRARLAKQVFAVENQQSNAQLAAESSLVLRVIVHGFLGLKTKNATLSMTPVCPAVWPAFKVRRVWLGHDTYDVNVTRITRGYKTMLTVEITAAGQRGKHETVKEGLDLHSTAGVTVEQGRTIAILFGCRGQPPISMDVLEK